MRVIRRLWFLSLLGLGLASCVKPIEQEEPKKTDFVSVPPEDAQELARAWRFIRGNKLVIAQMRLEELQEGASAQITRALASVATAEVLYRKKLYGEARAVCARHLKSPFPEVASDAYFITGKCELAEWRLKEARGHFDDARRIARNAGLSLREEKAREYIRFAEALIMIETGAYSEAREVLQSLREKDPGIRAIVDRIYPEQDE